jgi:subtilisin family serine protease
MITAPGGGTCGGNSSSILQYSLKPGAAAAGDYTRFGFVSMSGTSQSAAEVSGAAALVIASRVIGADPTPKAVANRLVACASGSGILDAGAATAPGPCLN